MRQPLGMYHRTDLILGCCSQRIRRRRSGIQGVYKRYPLQLLCIADDLLHGGHHPHEDRLRPDEKHEENAILYNDIYTTPERPYAEAEAEANNDEGKGKVIDLVIPVILIVFCIAGIMYSGGFFHGETDLLTPSPTVTRHRDCLLKHHSLDRDSYLLSHQKEHKL